MVKHIHRLWEILLLGSSSVVELRAFHYQDKNKVRRRVFRASEYESVDEMRFAFESIASELNNQGYNIYIVMNPINPGFDGKSAKDKDIRCRDLLLIDIDRAGDTKVPATKQEVKAAKKLATEIISYLSSLGWPEPLQVMSGNGWHLYYPLDSIANDKETTELVKKTLKNLAKQFNTTEVAIDTTVHNASRITKVPGTIMRKGEESKERPYRMARVYD